MSATSPIYTLDGSTLRSDCRIVSAPTSLKSLPHSQFLSSGSGVNERILLLPTDMEKRLAIVEHNLRTMGPPQGLERSLAALEDRLELLAADVADTQARLGVFGTSEGVIADELRRLKKMDDLVVQTSDGKTDLKSEIYAELYRHSNRLNDTMDAKVGDLQKRIDAELHQHTDRIQDMMDARVGDLQNWINSCTREQSLQQHENDRMEMLGQQRLLLKQYAQHGADQHSTDKKVAQISEAVDSMRISMVTNEKKIHRLEACVDSSTNVVNVRTRLDDLSEEIATIKTKQGKMALSVEQLARAPKIDQSKEILSARTKNEKLAQSVDIEIARIHTALKDLEGKQTSLTIAMNNNLMELRTASQNLQNEHLAESLQVARIRSQNAQHEHLAESLQLAQVRTGVQVLEDKHKSLKTDLTMEIVTIKAKHEKLAQALEQLISQQPRASEIEMAKMRVALQDLEGKQASLTTVVNMSLAEIRTASQDVQNKHLAEYLQQPQIRGELQKLQNELNHYPQIRADLQKLQSELNHYAAMSVEVASQSAQIKALVQSVADLSRQAEISRVHVRAAVENVRKEHATPEIVTTKTCADVTGSYKHTPGDMDVVIIQNGVLGVIKCAGSRTATYIINGNIVKRDDGANGLVNGESGSYSIAWSDHTTYVQQAVHTQSWASKVNEEDVTSLPFLWKTPLNLSMPEAPYSTTLGSASFPFSTTLGSASLSSHLELSPSRPSKAKPQATWRRGSC